MSVFNIYLIGYLILVVGLGLGAHLLGVSATWIGVGVIIMLGLGVMSAVSRSRRDPSRKV